MRDQLVPSHSSAKAFTPTARQKSKEAQETPDKPLVGTSSGLAVAMTDQPVPSHSSARVK